MSSSPSEFICVNRYAPRCKVLGPGVRSVLWVQGCHRQCEGCVAPETREIDGGESVSVKELAEVFSTFPDVEGITISGGEPMLQAEALNDFLEILLRKKPLSVMIYTGWLYEDILREGSDAWQRLLGRADILVDGPYIQSRHTNYLWRGSDNQRVIFLSERYRQWENRLMEDAGSQLEFEITHDSFRWMGIPPLGFREDFEERMKERGIQFKIQ